MNESTCKDCKRTNAPVRRIGWNDIPTSCEPCNILRLEMVQRLHDGEDHPALMREMKRRFKGDPR